MKCNFVHNKCHVDWSWIEADPQATGQTHIWLIGIRRRGVKQNGGASEERSRIWDPVTSRSEKGIRLATASGGIFTHNVATMSHRLAPFIHNFRYKNPEMVWFALTMEAASFSETLYTYRTARHHFQEGTSVKTAA